MITMRDALRLVEERREDAIVIPTMMDGRAWRELSDNPSMDLPVSGGMSKTSSVALGLSPSRQESDYC